MVKLPKNLSVVVSRDMVSLVRKNKNYDEELINLTRKQSTEVGILLIQNRATHYTDEYYRSNFGISDDLGGNLTLMHVKRRGLKVSAKEVIELSYTQAITLGVLLIKSGE